MLNLNFINFIGNTPFWLSKQHHGGWQEQEPYARQQKGSQEESG